MPASKIRRKKIHRFIGKGQGEMLLVQKLIFGTDRPEGV